MGVRFLVQPFINCLFLLNFYSQIQIYTKKNHKIIWRTISKKKYRSQNFNPTNRIKKVVVTLVDSSFLRGGMIPYINWGGN